MSAWMFVCLGDGITRASQSEVASAAMNASRGGQKCQGTVWGKSPLKTHPGYDLLFCSSYTSPTPHLTGPNVNIFPVEVDHICSPTEALLQFPWAAGKRPNVLVSISLGPCAWQSVRCHSIRCATGCSLPHRGQGPRRPSQLWGIAA